MIRDILEQTAQDILTIFEVHAPPIPIESMLQRPSGNLWDAVDPTQLSGSFMSVKEKFSPRMSLARLLVRHVASSEWGRARGLFQIMQQPEMIQAFARMLMMPRDMVLSMTPREQNPVSISREFEVPQSEAEARLRELLV
ncbi:MAG: hypothetical protein NZ750_00565 [Anaerolineae bacterium]|nr:hypothetical protein [Anaerolineae bacterium]MDW8173076.1 hypothetical protein [Anaerolineae bacterium]